MAGLRYEEAASGNPPVATELVGADHYQLMKLVDSAAGSIAPIGTAARPMPVRDDYTGGEVLAQQAGAGAVLTFTFASEVQLAVVESSGALLVSRADPFGGIPAAALGIPCRDEVPVYLPVAVTVVRVFAPVGANVNVWGFRR